MKKKTSGVIMIAEGTERAIVRRLEGCGWLYTTLDRVLGIHQKKTRMYTITFYRDTRVLGHYYSTKVLFDIYLTNYICTRVGRQVQR